MATFEYDLLAPPEEKRARELWMQHAAGFIVFQDAREYAMEQIDKNIDDETRSKIIEGIDNVLYGLMMIWDGVSGDLSNEKYSLRLQTKIILESKEQGKEAKIDEMDVLEGDGMCMGFHGWKEGNFGKDKIVKIKDEYK